MGRADQRSFVGAARDGPTEAGAHTTAISLHQRGRAVQVGERHGAARDIVFVGGAVTVVVEPVADVGADDAERRARQRGRVPGAHHRAAGALTHPARVTLDLPCRAIAVGVGDRSAGHVGLVDVPIAVVVSAVADIGARRRVARTAQRRAVGRALDGAAQAGAHAAAIAFDQARGTVEIGQLDRAAGDVGFVDRAVAVVVGAVTDVLACVAGGVAGQGRLVGGAHDAASSARAHATGRALHEPGGPVLIGIGHRSARDVVLVGRAVAVVVHAVADVLGSARPTVAGQRRGVRAAHDGAPGARADAAPVALHQPRCAVAVRELHGPPSDVVLVDLPVTVVVGAVADVLTGVPGGVAGQRRPVGRAHDGATATRARAAGVAQDQATGSVPVREGHAASGPEVLVSVSVAVVVGGVACLGGRRSGAGALQPGPARGTDDHAAAARADSAALAQREPGGAVEIGERHGAARGEVLVGLAVAVVVEAVAQVGRGQAPIHARELAAKLGRRGVHACHGPERALALVAATGRAAARVALVGLTVAVVVDAVARLGRAWAHPRLRVVAVVAGGPAVTVGVGHPGAVEVTCHAVLIDPVTAALDGAGVDERVVVVTVVGR